MAKRLSDISLQIEKAGKDFNTYLQKSLDSEVYTILTEICKITDVYIFSGIIRNYFLKVPGFRDIDIVIQDPIDMEIFFNGFRLNRNTYGGYKIHKNDITIDVWFLNNTWAFKHQPNFEFNLKELIPSTAFFNFSAVIYSFAERKFYASNKFRQFLRDKQIDLVYEPNPNLPLCVVNTFYYEDRFHLKVSAKMKRHIVNLYKKLCTDYQSVQEKHFGKVLYTENDMNKKIDAYSRSLEEIKPRTRRFENMQLL